MIKRILITPITLFLSLCLVLSVWFVSSIQAQTESFYRGKTIRVIVGTTSGGLYDRWARLLSQYMPKYIPGNPDMIVQNMPGAGSLVAANYVYGVAKPDGLSLGMFQFYIYMDQLTGRREVQFDLRRFNWIGSQEKSQMLLLVRADSPYKSIEDILKAKEPPKCSATSSNDLSYVLAKLLEESLGAKFQLVTGYQGGNEMDLALERGEVVCRGTRPSVYFSREPFITWHKKGFVRLLVQTGRKRDPRLLNAPTIYEIMDKYKASQVSRRVVEVIMAGDDYGRPMVAPPGVPMERVRMLREAYDKSLKDPGLMAQVQKLQMENVDPSTGEELQTLTQRVLDQPAEVIERLTTLFGQ